jgi:alditol oxidase
MSRAFGDSKLSNWAGNITYGTDRVYDAKSVERIRAVLKDNERVKVQGTRHCFNTIADSRFNLLSVRAMDQVVGIDLKARRVTVNAGISYGQLAPQMDGLALHNLASLPHISVAGAISTATHGSGEKNGNLSTEVTELELVTASGEIVTFARGSQEFQGAVVGLGALGVITKITLEVQPAYQVKQWVYQDLPLAAVKDHFDAIQASGYSVSLFWDWQNHRINELWIKSRTGEKEFAAPKEYFGAKLATRNLHPIADLSAENCTEQMGVAGPWYDRLPHFRMGFTPSAGKELQSEFFVPRRNAVDAILAIEKLRDQVSPLLLITEIRTIAADELWMSPCYKRDSVTIHFTWKPEWEAVRKVLPVIEKELGAYQCRPHWGKLFTMKPQYERLEEFAALAKKYDPKGKFRNEFLDRNIFAS